jgi:hypothetical protein
MMLMPSLLEADSDHVLSNRAESRSKASVFFILARLTMEVFKYKVVAINVVQIIYSEVIWHVKRGDKLSKSSYRPLLVGIRTVSGFRRQEHKSHGNSLRPRTANPRSFRMATSIL